MRGPWGPLFGGCMERALTSMATDHGIAGEMAQIAGFFVNVL
jgi:hypothetical protein